jgi:DNA-binding GntR family transcriptional regulator
MAIGQEDGPAAAVTNFGALPRASLADVIYERLRDAILQGDIPDGSRLSQVQLAREFGVSRIPIREALCRLQAELLVTATPYNPFVVRKISPEQVVELIDVRLALEDLALVRRPPIDAEELAELRRLSQKMARAAGNAGWFPLDRQFHRILAGSNELIGELIEDVRDRVRKYSDNMSTAKPGRLAANEEHAAIVDALEHGDTDRARALLHRHIAQTREFMRARLEHPED